MNSSAGLLPRPSAAVPSRGQSAPQPDTARRWLASNWPRLALPALLLITAAAYTWDLSASGYANSFYAAAVQAGTKSWKAFFFGSLDSSSFITVDKPPASLWVMALSGRIFGFDSLSMLIPQALEGVAAVALLYTSIRRWFGTGAGLAAGALLAVTPVAALMFRFNNPDALLVLLLVAAAYCLTRALERAGTRWVLAAGTMIGFAFLAKMMQAFLVLPAFALVYTVAAPAGLRRRVMQTLAGGLAVVISAGWWVAIVALWPAGSRPMIDGSPDNSILNLITGYNGLGRIFGSGGPGGGGGGGANFSGPTGLLRLFDSEMGGQASWLLPAALLALVFGLAVTRRAPRTDRTRAALLLWGGWLIVSGLVFSIGSGVIHTYYTVALAPAIAALVAIGGWLLWTRRSSPSTRVVAALTLVVTAGWAWELLDRTPQWQPWLRTLIVIAAAACLAGLAAGALRASLSRRLAAPVVALAVMACLAGPVAYAAQTITSAHTGSVPSAGPSSAGGFGGPGGFGGQAGSVGAAGSSRSAGSRGAGRSGGPGQTQTGAALERALTTDAGRYRWVAATSGSESAASLELATGGKAVMAIGGFNNQGGNITLSQFKQYVSSKEIHYYIASGAGMGGLPGADGGGGFGDAGAPPSSGGVAALFGDSGSRPSGSSRGSGGFGGGGPGGGEASSSQITTWVKAHFKAVTIGGETVYDLTQPLT
jgi:4-amino-4-deoxy-L-arabinose transferase-like glycosyltransferase